MFRLSINAAAALILTAGLSACVRHTSQASMAADPAAACVSSDTAAGLKPVLLANIDSPNSSNIAVSYRDQIVAGAELKLSKATLARYDKQTSTLSCSAEAVVTWPTNLATRLASISPNTDWASDKTGVLYSVQAKADGSGFDYAIQTGQAEIAGAVQAMTMALYQSDAKDAEDAAAAQATAALSSVAGAHSGPNQAGPLSDPGFAAMRAAAVAEARKEAQAAMSSAGPRQR